MNELRTIKTEKDEDLVLSGAELLSRVVLNLYGNQVTAVHFHIYNILVKAANVLTEEGHNKRKRNTLLMHFKGEHKTHNHQFSTYESEAQRL